MSWIVQSLCRWLDELSQCFPWLFWVKRLTRTFIIISWDFIAFEPWKPYGSLVSTHYLTYAYFSIAWVADVSPNLKQNLNSFPFQISYFVLKNEMLAKKVKHLKELTLWNSVGWNYAPGLCMWPGTTEVQLIDS